MKVLGRFQPGNQYWKLRNPKHPNLLKTYFKKKDIDRRKAIELYKQGLPLSKIGEILGCSKQTISRRLREWKVKLRPFVSKRIETLSSRFYPCITDSLMYLWGAILGDGHIDRKRHKAYIYVSTSQPEFVSAIVYNAEKHGLRPRVYNSKRDDVYVITINNKDFVKYLSGLKLEDTLVSKNLFTAFSRGFYDAEGSFVVKRRKAYKYPNVTITNKNLEILRVIQKGLEAYYQIHSSIRVVRTCWLLDIYRKEDVVKFVKVIGSTIPRKRGEDFIDVCDLSPKI